VARNVIRAAAKHERVRGVPGGGKIAPVCRNLDATGVEEARLKAVVVREFGGPEQLHLAEVADPVPGAGQVRVAVRAAGGAPGGRW